MKKTKIIIIAIAAMLSAAAILTIRHMNSPENKYKIAVENAEKSITDGDYSKAISELDKALKINDKDAGLWCQKIDAQLELSDANLASGTLLDMAGKEYSYYVNIAPAKINGYILDFCGTVWASKESAAEAEKRFDSNGWLAPDTGISMNDGTVRIFLDGKRIDCKTQPYIKDDRVLVPLHPLFEKLGWNVQDDPAQNHVTLYTLSGNYYRGKSIDLHEASHLVSYSDTEAAEVDGGVSCQVVIDTPPERKDGEMMIPLRIAAQIIGRSVTWDTYTYSVYIDSAASDEVLVDNETVSYMGVLGSGQSDNYVYDIDKDGQNEILMFGYSHDGQTAMADIYDRSDGGGFRSVKSVKMIDIDENNNRELYDFLILIDRYDWVIKLRNEAREAQEKAKREAEEAKRRSQTITVESGKKIAANAGGYKYASFLNEYDGIYYYRLTNDASEAASAEEQMRRVGHLPSGIEMVVYSVNKSTGAVKREN